MGNETCLKYHPEIKSLVYGPVGILVPSPPISLRSHPFSSQLFKVVLLSNSILNMQGVGDDMVTRWSTGILIFWSHLLSRLCKEIGKQSRKSVFLPIIKFLFWTLAHNKVPRGENLEKREFLGTFTCPMCQQNSESSDHIFLHCPYA